MIINTLGTFILTYSLQIALLNVELELKAEKENAEVRVDNVEEYQKVVDAEWNILYEKLDLIVKSGAKVVLSKLPIGDVATQVRKTHRDFLNPLPPTIHFDSFIM